MTAIPNATVIPPRVLAQARFRRAEIETVSLKNEGNPFSSLQRHFVIRITAPAALKGAYLQIGGSWRWATAEARDAALKDAHGLLKTLR